MFEASWCSPASQNTNLTFCQSPGGRWFFPYLQQSQQTLFPTSTAEFSHSFPLTSPIAIGTVSFTSPLSVLCCFNPLLVFFHVQEVCSHEQGRITTWRELLCLSSMNTIEICTLQWKNKYMNDQPLS